MSAAERHLGGALCALLVTAALTAPAHAQSPQKRADSLNEEGKTLLFAVPPNYQGASDKFRQAIVLSSEGRFYFNLCLAEYSMGDFGNALMACQAVGGTAAPADEKVQGNASDLLVKIKEQMRKQGMNPDAVNTPPNGGNGGNGTPPDGGNGTPPNGGNGTPPDGGNGTPPNGGNGTPPDGGTGGTGNPPPNGGNGGMLPPPGPSQFRGAPPPSLFATKPPEHDYTYTIGAALVGGSGSFGSTNAYGSSVTGVRILGDLLFNAPAKAGGEAWLDFLEVGAQDPSVSTNGSLSIFDAGVGLYKHFCSGRLCVTPMAGVQIAGYLPQAAGTSSSYVGLGGRLQGAIGYALGPRYEHYLTFNIGVDFDSKPLGSDALDAATYGLDRGAVALLFSIGYQYRFNTPFGQTPFFQLE
jgi:hypothetical protein